MNDPTRRRTLKDLLQAPEPMWLFQATDGRALGPVAEAMLLKGVLRGTLSQDTLVHPVGQPQWRPLGAFPRLARAIARLQARVSGVHMADAPGAAAPDDESDTGERSIAPQLRHRAAGE